MSRRIDLIGLPTDVHSSYLRGPAQAPPLIRAALFNDAYGSASERGVEIADIQFVDWGNLDLSEEAGDDARIRDFVARSLSDGAVPISLGGDHAVTYPILQAIAAYHGPVDILHFARTPISTTRTKATSAAMLRPLRASWKTGWLRA